MKNIFIFTILLLPLHLVAQQKLSGLISDEQGKPVDAATVVLSQNGKVLSSQLADLGKFELTGLSTGTYQLSVSFIGYKSVLRTFSLPKDSLYILLTAEQTRLKEVQITFRRKTIERLQDRIVFNLENSILASGGTVYDALSKSPGVQTSSDGSIKAYSKSATVYIDDKPVHLSGGDLSAYLQSLPADNISKIEVMPNPSAKYDADGGAVINIISKKSTADGINGSLSGGYTRGNSNRYTSNLLFNYRKDKLNIYGSFGYSDLNIRRNAHQTTIYQTPSSYSFWVLSRRPMTNSHGSSFTAGADYNLTANQVLGILITGSHSNTSGSSAGTTSIFNNQKLLPDSMLNTVSHDRGDIDRYSFNLNYKLKLDSAGDNLNIDFDFAPYSKTNTQALSNLTSLPDGSLASAPYATSSPASQKISIWSGKIDYAYHLDNSVTMESGLKYTSITSKDRLDFFNTATPVPQFDPSNSNRFQYEENTAAAYTDLTGVAGKWNFKGGLRAEYASTKGMSLSLDSINKKDYLQIFPTASVTYKASENDEFNLTYSRRIERPSYRQLNPAKNYLSPYDYSSGNPFLIPSISGNMELMYTLHANYTIAAIYAQTDNLVSNVLFQDDINKTYADIQENIGTIRELGTELTSSNSPLSWWEINNTGRFFYRTQSSDQPGYTYNYHQLYLYLRTDQSFTINKNTGLKAELSAWYSSPQQQGNLTLAKTYDLSAGLSKSIFNKQGTIRLSAADLLGGNTYNITVKNNGQINHIRYVNDTRTVALSFTYKFGKSIATARKRATASEEERKRAN